MSSFVLWALLLGFTLDVKILDLDTILVTSETNVTSECQTNITSETNVTSECHKCTVQMY